MADFPKYLMSEDGKSKFLPLNEAGILFSSLWSRVEIGGLVLNEDFTVRKITPQESATLTQIADDYDASK